MQNGKILIIDDEKIALKNLEHVMKKEGYSVVATQSGQNAIKLLEEQSFDVVLTDLRMEKVDGMQILKRCHELYPDTEVIMITGYATLETAVETMKHGAFYYISKPFKLDEVRKVVREAIEKVHLKHENQQLREQIENYGKSQNNNPGRKDQKFLIPPARSSDWCNVLLSGEAERERVIAGISITASTIPRGFFHKLRSFTGNFFQRTLRT
jgi:DNA-binding NtrC family response regulator